MVGEKIPLTFVRHCQFSVEGYRYYYCEGGDTFGLPTFSVPIFVYLSPSP